MNIFKIRFLLIIIVLTSCTDNKTVSEVEENQVVQRYMERLGQEIIIPENLLLLNNKEADILSTPYKIVTIIDANCISYINEFENWKPLIEIVKVNPKVSILFYVYAENMDDFMENRYPRIDINYPIIMDVENQYYLKNELFRYQNKNFHTYLVNSSNEIILIGNPSSHKNIRKQYSKVISSI